MDQSIKARVIDLAQGDPFLTVEQLAAEAQTTTRYVRTILSEANLSLNQMRREYARRLERNIPKAKRSPTMSLQRELRIVRVLDKEGTPQIASWSQTELFLASALHTRASLLSYVQLYTPYELRVAAGYESLRNLLPVEAKKLVTGEQKGEIVLASQELASLLELARSSQVLKLSSHLYYEQELVALEVRWFDLEGLILQWSPAEPELKVDYGT